MVVERSGYVCSRDTRIALTRNLKSESLVGKECREVIGQWKRSVDNIACPESEEEDGKTQEYPEQRCRNLKRHDTGPCTFEKDVYAEIL